MNCRPSEVDEEDEMDIRLWLLYDEVEARVEKRRREEK